MLFFYSPKTICNLFWQKGQKKLHYKYSCFLVFIAYIMMDINQTLKEFWLSDNQIEVYLVLLKLNSAPASSIARNTSIKRASIYPIIESLIDQWLVAQHLSWESKYFSAIHPEELQRQEETKLEKLKEKIPELVAMMWSFNNKPKLTYFEGTEGLKKLYKETLTSKEPIRAFLWTIVLDAEMKNFLNNDYLPARIKAGLRAHVLIPESKQLAKDYSAHPDTTKNQKKMLTHTKVIKAWNFMLSNEIDLFDGNKVAVVLYNEWELSGFIIQSKSLHDSLLSIFILLRESK